MWMSSESYTKTQLCRLNCIIHFYIYNAALSSKDKGTEEGLVSPKGENISLLIRHTHSKRPKLCVILLTQHTVMQ